MPDPEETTIEEPEAKEDDSLLSLLDASYDDIISGKTEKPVKEEEAEEDPEEDKKEDEEADEGEGEKKEEEPEEEDDDVADVTPKMETLLPEPEKKEEPTEPPSIDDHPKAVHMRNVLDAAIKMMTPEQQSALEQRFIPGSQPAPPAPSQAPVDEEWIRENPGEAAKRFRGEATAQINSLRYSHAQEIQQIKEEIKGLPQSIAKQREHASIQQQRELSRREAAEDIQKHGPVVNKVIKAIPKKDRDAIQQAAIDRYEEKFLFTAPIAGRVNAENFRPFGTPGADYLDELVSATRKYYKGKDMPKKSSTKKAKTPPPDKVAPGSSGRKNDKEDWED